MNVSIYPDPQRPISIPAVGCGGVVANRTLRVYCNDPWIRPPQPCPLWDAGAQAQLLGANGTCDWNVTAAAFQGDGCSVTCYWNATAQAFAGAGCVIAPSTSCGCRHLTEFASSSAPTISTCSASDMLSLSPGDIVTKLRVFLIMICGLFGGMHLGAFFAWLLDRQDHHNTISHLQAPEGDPKYCGFRKCGPEGAWTWHLLQTGVDGAGDIYAVQGTLVQAAAVIGLPAARLRMAIPDEARKDPGPTRFSLSLHSLLRLRRSFRGAQVLPAGAESHHIVGRNAFSASWLKDNHPAVSEKVLTLWGADPAAVQKRVGAAKERARRAAAAAAQPPQPLPPAASGGGPLRASRGVRLPAAGRARGKWRHRPRTDRRQPWARMLRRLVGAGPQSRCLRCQPPSPPRLQRPAASAACWAGLHRPSPPPASSRRLWRQPSSAARR